MQRPHIPRLAFHLPAPANGRPSAELHSSSPSNHQAPAASFAIEGRSAAVGSGATNPRQPLFHSRAPARHTEADDQFEAKDAYGHDDGSFDEHASHSSRDAEFDSEPVASAAANNKRSTAARSQTAYERAKAVLDEHSDLDDETNRSTTANSVVSQQQSRRSVRDESVVITDARTTEREIRPTSHHRRNSSLSSRRSTRSSTAPDASEQLSAATSSVAPSAGAPATAAANSAPVRSRMDRGALRNWMLSAAQQRQRAELMEREHLAWLLGRGRAWFAPGSEELHSIAEMEKFQLDAAERLKREREYLSGEIRRVKQHVKRFVAHVAAAPTAGSDAATSDAYLTALRRQMETIEEALASFKSRAKEKYIELNTTEKELTTELDAIMTGFDRWQEQDLAHENHTTPTKQQSKAKPPTSTIAALLHPANALATDGAASSSSTGDCDDALETDATAIRAAITHLEDTIASEGGPTGGWDARDHAHFLKLRTQLLPPHMPADATPPPAFLARLVAEVSDQTPATALAHVEWYARYLANLDAKKSLLARWKALKAAPRKKDAEEMARELERAAEAEKEEKKALQVALERERAEKAAQVAEWRAEKQAREEARKARLVEAQAEKERQAREKAEDERRRLKSIVTAYHEEQAVSELINQLQSAPTQREVAERAAAEREAKRARQERADAMLREIKSKRAEREAETARVAERKEALARAAASNTAAQTQRDPSRLTQPTSAMRERARQREAEEEGLRAYAKAHGGRTPQTMLARPVLGHTATPAWRKGL